MITQIIYEKYKVKELKERLAGLTADKYAYVRKDGTISESNCENKLIWYFLNYTQLPAIWKELFDTKFPLLELPVKLIERLFNIPTKEDYGRIYIQHIIIAIINEIYLGELNHFNKKFSIIKEIDNEEFTPLNLKKWSSPSSNIALYLFITNTYDIQNQARLIIENLLSKKYITYKLEKSNPEFCWNRKNN